ncbi:MAG: flagellar hook-associated protein FlgK, partial [Lachnospiraceae bacterium]|nr:flagellar hook-associated protein FlgK [Lachnospiraceae bacterium]
MASTFFGLHIGVTGMSAYQVALNTSAHNISNAGKAGYSKQTVSLTAENALSVPSRYGMVGTGVRVVDITQNRNKYYDDKFRYNTSIQCEYETKEYYLSCIQSYLYSSDETVAGMTTSFDNFFNSLTTMTSEASDMVKRTDAAILSETFVKDVGDFAIALQILQVEANTQIETVISQINALGSSIASVTQQINTYEITGETANDLRDERNMLLDELSKYVNISSKETAPEEGKGNPQFLVYINGALLVDTTESYELKCIPQDTSINQCDIDNLFRIEWNNGQGFNMRSKSLGGELQALIEFRDGNNENNFRGTAGSVATEDGVTKVTVKDTNFNDLFVLSIPESKGRITIANVDYEYDSFHVNIAEDGTYEYEFTLKGERTQSQIDSLQYACDHSKAVLIGESISSKGVPYYMQ